MSRPSRNTSTMTAVPRRLAAILASLDPWLRARVASITVWPTVTGGWVAQLSYVHHTTPPPSDLKIPAGNATYPGDTHHPLDLPFDHPEPALIEQIRELEAKGEVGKLRTGRASPHRRWCPARQVESSSTTVPGGSRCTRGHGRSGGSGRGGWG